MSRIILFTVLLLTPFLAFSQKRIKLNHADSLKGSMRGEKRFDRLLGHVSFVQNTTNIFCDSAYFFRSENRLEAFGHVHITDDSVDITALQLEYDGTKKIAHLRRNVVFEKIKIAKLYTDYLDYYRNQ